MVSAGLLGGLAGGATVAITIRAIDKFSATFALANKSMLKLGGALTILGVAGAAAVGGLLKVAGQFEQTNIAFSTMLGSGEKAQVMLKDLANFAARTPFQIPDVEKNAKLLLAMGIEAEKIIPTMKALGDVSAGLSVPLERIALNFGQVRTQGKLTGRELRDFNIAGVPLIQELSKNLNIAEKEIKEMVSRGEIGFDLVEQAFISMSSEGGKFFDLMDAQSHTFLGQMSNIQDSLVSVGREMGKVLLPAAKNVAGAIQRLVEWLQEHPTVTKFAGAVLAIATALALTIGPLLLISAIMPILITSWATFTAVTLPWTLAILGVIAILGVFVATLTMVLENFDEFKIGMAMIWNDIVSFFERGINKVIGWINYLIRGFNKIAPAWADVSEIPDATLGRIDVDAMTREVIKNRQEVATHIAAQDALLNVSKGKSKSDSLVDQLAGLKVLYQGNEQTGFKYGDIFNPSAFRESEFNSLADYQQAQRGGGTTINIDNVNGLDPGEISRALANEFNSKVST